MKRYQHIFFDLDHTLWDFETNSRNTLGSLFESAFPGLLHQRDEFIDKYIAHNNLLWDQYAKNRISKEFLREERFVKALEELGISDKSIAADFADRYLDECPRCTTLMPFANELLDYLQSRYQMHIISNGFAETQKIKLACSGLEVYFSQVVTSERAGYRKPQKGIFEYALKEADAEAGNSLMIGDHFEADVLGAKEAGMDQVYYNPAGNSANTLPTYQIRCLSELLSLL